ncbi:glutathione S-transferase family protein [Gilvimarinus sp. F26214L]|uniref:glutathione S-transferase family protein n=1 Tax=Gilvimarinus sp. DZF01 TaxID=3461371 RepID=UPI0040465788
MTTRKISAYTWVPPFAQGLVRDLRVRWALEEAGFDYQVNLIDHPNRLVPDYLAKQPFGQVPVYEEDDLVLFESGAIVLHIAHQSAALMPEDPTRRAKVTTWLFAALNSVENDVSALTELDVFHGEEDWAKQRRPMVEEALNTRLEMLAAALGEDDYLADRFTVADLMMSTVLRILRHTDVLARFPALAAYRQRCEARPAFQRALDGQMTTFAAHEPAEQQ